ncbi:ORF6N domain-containing protein [Acinetobacter baumannii]|uniref:ORF6N domain-containing protein n=1 Tax=Acinetobacter baumannii TaxID=470 RepID=UPI00105835F6|nr:ORF6N domain-containing protein [Acinetobacter baumannii]MDC4982330.1 ORF6N domain-containing protein [Acinetobacter baumannii]MDC5255689.1 ORF6N domain-containing protein [Acinetobacter baumannii]MDC5298093.1 ORF6N domain-containing protein [Acinetobacter baumannii]MDC5371930.1 ORF6N domain-containing protein [Acinetobacter baumannii]QBM32295.1 ORF6N domain-containing protein [Acinetobacter baumannii]
MSTLTQINDTQVSVISFKSIPVVTTEMLAGFYGTESVRIRQNHHENKQRFIEGKHFFKIVGQELKDFVSSLKLLANSPIISNKVRSLILWTERGAARHAKMLDTDQAWEVFEQLEDCYFVRKEILAKTHKSEREPLTNAVNLLVAKTKHLNYSDAYKLVHQRFNVQHIDEIPYDMIPVAVEYVHHLIAMYSSAEKKAQGSLFDNETLGLVKDLVDAIISQNFVTSKIYRAIHMLSNEQGHYLAEYAFKTNIAVLKLTRTMDLRGPLNREIISDDLKTISYTTGNQHYGDRWFHPLMESSRLMGVLEISGSLIRH